MSENTKDTAAEELRDEIVENGEEITEAQADAVDVGKDEQEVVKTADKAADATKKGTPPSTKAGMISAMYNVMSKMNKDKLMATYNKMMEGVEVTDEEVELLDASKELDVAMANEATLSDEFKEKTSLIFEAAVRSKMSEEVSRLEESFKQELAEEIAATKDDMVNKIDSYLNYVVESWMEENKLAIEAGIRTEIAENFMNKLKDVFVESYIDVPESKVDLVDDLSAQVTELEEKLDKVTSGSIELSEEVKRLKRAAIIAEASADLAKTQAEKLNTLVEDVAFEDVESFAKKVATIKESFFAKVETQSSTEDLSESVETEGEAEQAEVSGSMAQYLKYLKK